MDEIKQYKERLQIALKAAKICIFEVDLLRQLYTFFENAEVIFGISGEKILKDVRPYSQLDPESYRLAVSEYFSHPDDMDVIEGAFRHVLSGIPATYEARMKAGGSEYVWCRVDVVPILEDGNPVRMVGVITDIRDIKEKTERLKKAIHLDNFTGLYNKGYTITLINQVMEQEQNEKHALVVLDIDNFKNFNDQYGHSEGDKIILTVSQHIKKAFRKSDIVGRFGGDEFIVFVQDFANTQWLRGKLTQLTRLEVDGYVCTNSIGVAFFPQDGADFNVLFKNADAALYHAKIEKERLIFFSEMQ